MLVSVSQSWMCDDSCVCVSVYGTASFSQTIDCDTNLAKDGILEEYSEGWWDLKVVLLANTCAYRGIDYDAKRKKAASCLGESPWGLDKHDKLRGMVSSPISCHSYQQKHQKPGLSQRLGLSPSIGSRAQYHLDGAMPCTPGRFVSRLMDPQAKPGLWRGDTPWKTIMDPENHWLVEENTLPWGHCQGLC